MNRIYQVVWSKAKNCYTVVSEIAKRHGKGNRARTCAAAFLAALALTSVMGMSEAQAQTIDADGISNGDARIALNGAAGMVGMVNGKDASIFMYGGNTTINKKVTIDQTGKIIGVAAGAVTAGSTDAVNGGQLHAVAAEASKHSKVVNGSNINVEESEVNGQKIYKVGLNDDVRLGMIETTGSITTKDSISAANGAQLADINVSGNVISNGKAAIALYGDSGIAGMKNGKGASIYMQDGHTSINEKVNIDQNGKITGVAAGAVTAGSTDAVNGSQLHAVATEAGKHSKVVNGSNINVEESEVNGQKIYKVGLNDDVRLGTIETTGSIATKDRISADKGAQLADINVSGNIISNGAAKIALNDSLGMAAMVNGKGASIFMQDGNTVINRKVAIDKEGNITGTNAVNANVVNANTLNAKYNLNVGEMAENGYMPFFVNSTGDFYAANNKFSVGKDGKVTATAGEIGGVTINKGIFYKNTALRDGELFVGDASGNYSQITTKGAKLGKVTVAEDGKITGVAAGAVTAGSTDAVNGSQLHAVATEAAKHSKVVNGSNIKVEEAEVNGQKIYKVGLNDDVLLGKLTGNNVSLSGTNGTIETTGYIATKDRIIADKGAQLAGINVSGNIISNGAAKIALYGDSGVAGMVNGKGASIYMQDGNTIINSKVAIDKDGKITGVAAGAVTAGSTDAVNGGQLHAVAADVAQNKADIAQNKADIAQNKADIAQNKADIAQNKADIAQNKADIAQNKTDIAQNKADIAQNKADIGKLDNRVTNVENLAKQHTTVEAGNNITVTESTNTYGGKKYTVGMAKDITVDSVKVGDKTYVSKDGLNANNQTITNVKDGKIEEGSKDAVNGGQLYATNQLVKDNASNISLLGNSINKLDNRVDKVGAGAAALAALHPLDFDPEDKWDFAAGYGNYSGASAVALGAYYRPNEDTMFSVGGSFGNGENMVNAGVSLKLGQSNRAPASKAAMEKKISALSQEVEELKAAIADLRAAQTKAKDATAKDAQKK